MTQKKRPEKIDDRIISLVRNRTIGTRRFKLNCPAEIAYHYISASFISEVEKRGQRFILNEFHQERIWEMAQLMTENNGKFGALICGNVGNGKTTLLKATAKASLLCQDAGYVNANDYGFEYKADFGFGFVTAKELARYAKSDYATFEKFARCPLLALDELGEEPKEVLEYGNVINPLIDALEERYSKQLFTLITSNYGAQHIGQRYGERIADRLREMLAIIPFGDHKSYRT